MATMRISSSPWTVPVDVNEIDVTSRSATWRESWKATDSNGHEHAYDRSGWPPFPTLNEIIDESHWCDGDEGFARHDPHEHVDASHFECKICGELVEPGTDPPFTPKSVAGTKRCTVEGPRSDGTVIVASLTEDEFDRIVAAGDDWDAVQAVVDAVPDDRIWSRSFASR
jgi:hypothetical protein